MSDEQSSNRGTIGFCLVALGVIAMLFIVCTGNTTEEKTEEEIQAEQQAATATQEAEARLEEERRKQGFHCLESRLREPKADEEPTHTIFGIGRVEYVPLVEAIETQVKEALPDPGSMVIHDLRITPVDENGQHRALLDFGARNMYGGMQRFHLVALVDSESCAPVDFLGIEEIG